MYVKMTAESARRIADETLENIEDIMGEIMKCANAGRYQCTNEGALSKNQISALKELGYDVSGGTQYNQSYYTIRW